MHLKVSPFYALLTLLTTILLLIGGWWIFLLNKLIENPITGENRENFIFMMKWEGITFFILIGLLFGLLIYLYRRNEQISHSLKTYFAAINHELKTPLASIKMQTNIIEENFKDNEKLSEANRRYFHRIYNDINDLEVEINNSLVLANLKKTTFINGTLNLIQSIKEIEKKYQDKVNLIINTEETTNASLVYFNEHFFNVIFRNLLNNSLKHSRKEKSDQKLDIQIDISVGKEKIELTYNDFGKQFTGEVNKLGDFLYHHNSAQGKGIGLYLIKELMNKSKGNFKVSNKQNLVFNLTFLKCSNHENSYS